MQNKIDAALSAPDRDKILDLINQIFDLLPMKIDLTPEERQTLVKMGESGRPFVESALLVVEQDDAFMPRTFDKVKMRHDSDFYAMLTPVSIQLTKLCEAVSDTLLLTGSDMMMAGLDIYSNAKNNGTGEHLDGLVPLLGRRFKLQSKKETDEGEVGAGSTPSG